MDEQRNKIGKGLIEQIIEGGAVHDYDPYKGITIAELTETIVQAHKEFQNRPKPEHILSKWEAQNLELWQLEWLGNNYTVLCSLEVSDIVKDRFKKESK